MTPREKVLVLVVLLLVAMLVVPYVFARMLQYFLDRRGRRVFRCVTCPQCGKTYGAAAVRRARHLVKCTMAEGASSESFSAVMCECWEVGCDSCSHVQDFDRDGDVIRFDEPPGASEPEPA